MECNVMKRSIRARSEQVEVVCVRARTIRSRGQAIDKTCQLFESAKDNQRQQLSPGDSSPTFTDQAAGRKGLGNET